MSDTASAYSTQLAAERLSTLLQRLGRMSYDDFPGVTFTADNTIAITAEQAFMLNDALLSTLPRCFAVPDGGAIEEECAMPDSICHGCARESRRLPTG